MSKTTSPEVEKLILEVRNSKNPKSAGTTLVRGITSQIRAAITAPTAAGTDQHAVMIAKLGDLCEALDAASGDIGGTWAAPAEATEKQHK